MQILKNPEMEFTNNFETTSDFDQKNKEIEAINQEKIEKYFINTKNELVT